MCTRRSRFVFALAVAIALIPAGLLPAAVPTAAAATVQLSRTLVASGDIVVVSANGLTPRDNAVVYTDLQVQGVTRRIQTAVTTNGSGSLTATLTVPAGTTPNTYAAVVKDFHSHTVSQTYTVLPLVVLKASSNSGTTSIVAGHSFFARGTGFKAGETVKFLVVFPLYNGDATAMNKTVITDQSGSFGEVLVTVPFAARTGNVTLSAVGQTTNRKATTTVTVLYRPGIALKSSTIRPGATASISGYGFVADAVVKVSIVISRNGAPSITEATTVRANQYGQFSATIALPSNTWPATYTVAATSSIAGLSASTRLTVAVKPAISVSSAAVFPGQTVTIMGTGYSANARITVQAAFPLSGGGSRTVSTITATTADGSFSTKLTVPDNAAAGSVVITALEPNGRATVRLQVREFAPSIAVTPSSVIPGGNVTVSGSGFLGGGQVTITARVLLTNGTSQTISAAAKASADGRFAAVLHVPENARGGSYTVTTRSTASGRSATTSFTVARLAPSLIATPSTAIPGTQVTVNGFGFAAGVSLAISLNGQKLGMATTNSNGQFTARLTIPSDLASGTYALSAVSGTGIRAATDLNVNRQVSTHFYFASFYTGRGYGEYIALVNPSAINARITITYQLRSGRTYDKVVSVKAHTRFTENVNTDLGPMVSAGAVVAADVPIMASRIVYHGTDGAIDPGVTSPSTAWYFANGNTGRGYREYLAILNPNTAPARLWVTFLPAHHRAFTVVRAVAPTSRLTLKINTFVKQGAVGVRVTANVGVVVNRTIFIHSGMTSKTGVTAPMKRWYFAAGPQSGQNWIGVVNPTTRWSYVTVHAYGPAGLEIGDARGWLRPHAQFGYRINRLAHRADAAVVVLASRGIVAEQTTYNGSAHNAFTDTFGVPSPAQSWAFADASTAAGRDILNLFNPNLIPIPVVVDFLAQSGQTIERTYIVGPLAHRRVEVESVIPNAQLGIVTASNYQFVAMNRVVFMNGLGSDTSAGTHM